MSSYAATAASAAKLLRSKGTLVSLRKHTTQAYDPAETKVTDKVTIYSGAAVFLPVDGKEIDGETILRTDKLVYLSAVNIPDPAPGDELVAGATSYRVITAESLAPAGLSVIHILRVRAGG